MIRDIHTLILSTGSNLGNRQENLETAGERIGEKIGKIRKSSCIYESLAWGYQSENRYYNQCLEIVTDLAPVECMERILAIERQMGRERASSGYADRIIDIDILFYDELILETDHLSIPHKKMHERRFVLLPLTEILPGFRHPVLQRSVRELLERCGDPLEVTRI